MKVCSKAISCFEHTFCLFTPFSILPNRVRGLHVINAFIKRQNTKAKSCTQIHTKKASKEPFDFF